MSIALLLSDVDGTLVTHDKVLTETTKEAVAALRRAGIGFAITSARPPAGMAMLIEPLAIKTPIAGFNGGVYVDPRDGSIIAANLLDPQIARRALDILLDNGIDAWAFSETQWMVRNPATPLVARERRTLRLEPVVVDRFPAAPANLAKIVGASEDHARVERCEARMQAALGAAAIAVRSQPYYLDITHPQANKGAVVDFLSQRLGIAHQQIATIGDMPNDVRMFRNSGLSIAMGNASAAVKSEADCETGSSDEDGFAAAVERFVLPQRMAS